MSKKSLRFTKIEVKKMPGLGNGLKPYENLSPYINIIAGPNASGKSSTARAIQQLLWQSRTDRITASGQFTIDNKSWLSEVDSTYTNFQKDGNNADLKGIPSIEERSRYMLSLQDLIREEESDLAESILKDAIGGYDIDKAYNNLGYSDSKKTTNAKQSSAFKEARERLGQIRDDQKKLQVEQGRLEGLEKEETKAKEAKERADFYKLVLNFKEKQENLQGLKEQLSEFPDKMARVKEDDYTNFGSLLTEIHDQGKAVEGFERDIEKLREKKGELNLPENGIDSLEISKAGNYLEELDDLESDIREAESEIEKSKKDLEQASMRLGLEVDKTDFEGLDADSISVTEQLWQKGFDLIGQFRQTEQQIEKLEAQQKETPQSNVLISGISELSKWLSAHGSPANPISKVYLWLIGFVALCTAVAVQFIGSFGYIGVAVVAIILYLIYTDQNRGGDSAVSMIETYYEKTGLEAPIAWKAEEVSQRLEELIQALEEAKRQEDLKKQLSEKKDQLNEANDELETFEEEVDKLEEKIKVLPSFNAENLKNYSSLYWHLKYVLDWDSARDRINAEESAIEKTKENIQVWLDKINSIFEKYGLNSVSNYADAKAGHKRLQELREQFNELSGKIEKAESEQKRAREDKEKAEANLQKICKRLDVSPEDLFQVKELVDELEAYKTLKQKVNTAEGLLDDTKKTMENNDLHEVNREKIAEISIDDVKSKIERFGQEAEKLEALQKQITEIETRVKDTKRKHDLEQALQKEEEALLDLEELYKENAGSIIGDLLVKHLKDDLGEKNMPEVFDRAKNLFKRITKNRYELVVDSIHDKAEFRAKDMRFGGVGRSLEELSTGTRIQLIMSVRLAFIEQAEDEIKLPVLADELLANSDSLRAGAIIDALIEISREGRQIFYFTAQEDEVAKWEYKLKNEPGADYKVYLIEKNEETVTLDEDVLTGIQLQKEIPQPGSVSYVEYGKVLEVPSLANVFTPVDQLHIWYLLDDPDLLYKILKQGIENWGMLKSYFKEEGVVEGLDENARTKIEQRAEVIERYLELLRHGQNKPIDRQILEESDAVNENRMDEVSELLSKKNGDPGKLIQGLYDSEVKRYFNSKTQELEDYLIGNGYIQQNEPFSFEEIQTKMMAFISTKDITKEEAQTFLDRLSSS